MSIVISAFFLIGLLATAIICLLDHFVFAPKRTSNEKGSMALLAEWARWLLPVFIIVFVLRSFVMAPFRIPSGSMLPTLQIGDLIIVNKLSYHVELPITHTVLFNTWKVKRGDVIVFRYPVDPRMDFIKRVIGLPGDHIAYINKRLYVNGKPVEVSKDGMQLVPTDSTTQPVELSTEKLGTHTHQIINMPWRPATDFKNLVVPKGEYFVMGDNRDNSDDGRYWGFVKKRAIVGKAELIFFNINFDPFHIGWSQIGKIIH